MRKGATTINSVLNTFNLSLFVTTTEIYKHWRMYCDTPAYNKCVWVCRVCRLSEYARQLLWNTSHRQLTSVEHKPPPANFCGTQATASKLLWDTSHRQLTSVEHKPPPAYFVEHKPPPANVCGKVEGGILTQLIRVYGPGLPVSPVTFTRRVVFKKLRLFFSIPRRVYSGVHPLVFIYLCANHPYSQTFPRNYRRKPEIRIFLKQYNLFR
jgi:hypothetical protein